MIDKQAILQAFDFRHACKTFDPARRIPDDDFHLILETGRLSPSSFGVEPWRFLALLLKSAGSDSKRIGVRASDPILPQWCIQERRR